MLIQSAIAKAKAAAGEKTVQVVCRVDSPTLAKIKLEKIKVVEVGKRTSMRFSIV